MYFLGAMVIVTGVLYLNGYIGSRYVSAHHEIPLSVNDVIGHTKGSQGDCVSCKWY